MRTNKKAVLHSLIFLTASIGFLSIIFTLFVLSTRESLPTGTVPLEEYDSGNLFFNPNKATWHRHVVQTHDQSVTSKITFLAPTIFLHSELFTVSDVDMTIHNVPFSSSEFVDCNSFAKRADTLVIDPVPLTVNGIPGTACRSTLTSIRPEGVRTVYLYALPYRTRLALFSVTFVKQNCENLASLQQYSDREEKEVLETCTLVDSFDPDVYIRSVLATVR